jgi:hypothetical protein
MDNRNLSETLPYGKLAMLGIDREKADLLSQEVKEKLLFGEVTLFMQVFIRAQNGNAVTLPLKQQWKNRHRRLKISELGGMPR